MLKRTLRFVFCSIFIIAISSGSAFTQEMMKLSSVNKHSHEIPIDSAKKFIANLNKDAMQMKTKGGMFYREAFDKILAQKGCMGIRYYYAKTDDGTPTLVLVGVDSTGNDMSTASVVERGYPCPPFCSQQTSLVK